MKRNLRAGIGIGVLLLIAVVLVGVGLNQPAYSLTMDINPSIEIKASRLDRVVEINPLNNDARELLKDFSHQDKNLKKTVEDLADLMVLKGYITGGEDNLVLITVNDEVADKETVDNLNHAIVAYLQNKQIEATVVNQSIPDNIGSEARSGKEIVADKIKELDDDSSMDELLNMKLKELLQYAEERNITAEELFSTIIGTKATPVSAKADSKPAKNENEASSAEKKEVISEEEARKIALEKVNGTITDFEFGYDDGRPEYEIEIKANGKEYDIEIDGYTGKITDFDVDDDDDHNNKKTSTKTSSSTAKPSNTAKPKTESMKNESEPAKTNKKEIISAEEAKKIALAKVNGTITDFEFDYDDGRPEYEIEIKANGKEYEIEIDGYTGKITDFDVDNDD